MENGRGDEKRAAGAGGSKCETGGVKVQEMVGRPINDRETLTSCQPPSPAPSLPLTEVGKKLSRSMPAGGSRAGRLLRFPIRDFRRKIASCGAKSITFSGQIIAIDQSLPNSSRT